MSDGMSDRIQTFEQFWLFYLGEHAKPGTRTLHLIGTTGGALCGVLAVALRAPVFLPVGLAVGYAFAMGGHFLVERNRPATFRHPVWSFAADWKMWAYALTGRLGRELARAGVRQHPM